MVFTDLAETPSKTETSTFSYTLPATLVQGTTYYWKVVGKTMALQTKTSAVWTFTTAGVAPPPPPTGSAEIVLYASKAPLRVGAWQVESDSTAAGGAKIRNPNAGAAKITTASANPANYFELTFNAQAGVGYRLWLRGRADSNSWANDSVFVQFNNSVTSTGTPTYRIGTTSAAEVNLEDCSGCGLAELGLAGQRVRPQRDGPADLLRDRAGRRRCACRSARMACRSTRSCCRTRSSSTAHPGR